MPLPRALVLLLLVPALLAAGCTKTQPGETLLPASASPTGPTPAATTSSTPPTTSTPPTSTSPPSTTTPPQPPPDTTVPPPKHPDQHLEATGWVEVPPPAPGSTETGFKTSLGFPVYEGVKNGTMRVEVVSTYPQVGRLPRELATVNITLLDPDGKPIGNAVRVVTDESPAATLTFDATKFVRFGEHSLVIRITGASDGSSLGDKFFATVDVHY